MRVGVIIPDRGDRPLFMDNCTRMLKAQTLQPVAIMTMQEKPVNDLPDITMRYRKGYRYLRDANLDVIAFIENDDWYSPQYLETMVKTWENAGRPDLLGTSYTYYYHIKEFAYFKMEHYQRSSGMSTLIKPDLDIDWPNDSEPYTDSHLWFNNTQLKKVIFTPDEMICLGIKHAVGKCGGQNHNTRLDRYVHKDADKNFLRRHLDPSSFEFYSNYFNLEK